MFDGEGKGAIKAPEYTTACHTNADLNGRAENTFPLVTSAQPSLSVLELSSLVDYRSQIKFDFLKV